MLSEVTVVKVGGSLLDDAAGIDAVTGALAERHGPLVVVHGGGRGLTAAQRLLRVEPRWEAGLRVTCDRTLQAATWVLSGEVNKRLVRALLDHGVDALGVSGEDAGLLRARVADRGRLGHTGEIVAVRAAVLRALLLQGLTPVLSPLSRGEGGEPLNVNADEAAAAVARALRAPELLLVSDVGAVRGAAGALRVLGEDEVDALIASGAADGGMVPKLRAAREALRGGVAAVRIGGVAMLRDPKAGTLVGRARTVEGGLVA